MATRYDEKTGKRKTVNAKRSAAAKKAGRKRKGHKHSAATKKKISMALKKAHRTGKTKFGRKVKKTGPRRGAAHKAEAAPKRRKRKASAATAAPKRRKRATAVKKTGGHKKR